ncbi:MAG: hypothetical protein Q8R45_13605 [Brevundimonas sp.]|uniref:hypothetical protein n=1 Tax=Brevundimonas sp. TaxID=1871086 RepID=UPI002733EA99|nr:hypothetical protein [Brevundimonas sp.]MDP3657984.1 hypothetical protein [Brevundimonas sp.]MDZ4112708.1 hypothetical protein [Brevundimonas sp.]
MNPSEVIASVAGDLNSTEQSLDATIAHATTLIQSMIGARTALNLSSISGAVSQAKAMDAIAALATAREAIVACHEELARDHRRHGYGVYASGHVNKPAESTTTPPTTGELVRESRLRAV